MLCPSKKNDQSSKILSGIHIIDEVQLTVLGCWPNPSFENAFVLVSFSQILNLSISRSIILRASMRSCS